MSYLKVSYNNKPFTNYPSKLAENLIAKFKIQGKNKKLLDIACGRGEFVISFKNLGFDCYAFDNEDNYKKNIEKNKPYVVKLWKHLIPYMKLNNFDKTNAGFLLTLI